MATTPYYGGQSTPFEPVCSSHAAHLLAPKDVQRAPALQRLDPHGYEPVCLSPMPPPAARRTNAAGKQTKSCNRFGCSYKSTFPGNVGRHYTFSCELRNEAERHYADQLTTCYLCETQPKYSRLDVLRRHIRSKHYEPDLKPKIKGLQKKRNSAGSSAYIDSRNFYGSY